MATAGSHHDSPGTNSLLSQPVNAPCAVVGPVGPPVTWDSLKFHSDDECAVKRRIRVVPRGDPASLIAGCALF